MATFTSPQRAVAAPDAEGTYQKVSRRLVPLLLLCYVIAYLDRVNVGFAKLQMLEDLGFSELVYGTGAGIFFIGYFFFEIPSNLILHRVGARRWIGRIMITWGLVSIAMAFVKTELQFYVLRFLLGLSEAGFFPGIVLYLTQWYPAERRGRVTSLFMSGVSIAGIIGGPLSGWIMDHFHEHKGWDGWQWMFILEGIPSVLLGFVIIAYLDDHISNARWLSPEEKALLTEAIAAEEASKAHLPTWEILRNTRVWVLSLIYFCFVMGVYGVSFWLPTLIKNMGIASDFHVGLLTMIPWTAAAIGMILLAKNSDRTGERHWHTAGSALLGALGLVLSVLWADQHVLAMAALSLATVGIFSCLPVFWSLPTEFLAGAGAAAGIALINSVGNLAGFLSPYLVGWVKTAWQSTDLGLYLLAGFLTLGAGIVVKLRGSAASTSNGGR